MTVTSLHRVYSNRSYGEREKTYLYNNKIPKCHLICVCKTALKEHVAPGLRNEGNPALHCQQCTLKPMF